MVSAALQKGDGAGQTHRCAAAIAVGDMIPFLLGRIFGVRLLRLRWLRYLITKQRLATFDHWFRQRGDLVIVISERPVEGSPAIVSGSESISPDQCEWLVLPRINFPGPHLVEASSMMRNILSSN